MHLEASVAAVAAVLHLRRARLHVPFHPVEVLAHRGVLHAAKEELQLAVHAKVVGTKHLGELADLGVRLLDEESVFLEPRLHAAIADAGLL